jgi:DNA-3-methyladenine glycosylase II
VLDRAAHTSLVPLPPFRLDLTVAVLRRLPAHPVEVLEGGRYLRAFETPRGPVAWIVTQPPATPRLRIELRGAVDDPGPWRARVERALGTGADLTPFYRRARAFPQLARMARASRGVKPPRFQSLHESFASVLLFQQVSLASAMSTLRRLVIALAAPVEVEGVTLRPFPSAEAIARSPEEALRSCGMSGAKARALRAVAAEVASGDLDEGELARLPSPALAERLRELPGVGPWSAALLMLRGFGRLDQFPPGDAAAERLLRDLGSGASGRSLLEALGDARGLLYYHLFLDRMARSGEGPFAAGAGRSR